jgi:SAM-dependent methyltransferase
MAVPRRLLFGEVAELYDAYRPTYPAELIDDLAAVSGVGPGTPVLEVGAGTGKATLLFAALGARVLALEPSPPMAEVARRNCADYPQVAIVESDFERWDPVGARFPLLYSAQAWHWIDPAVGYRLARTALVAGGVLAAFWNRPAWGWSPIRKALASVYTAAAPDLAPVGPTHPANENPDGDDYWEEEIAGADGLSDAEVRSYDWSIDYSAQQYAGMLTTLSEVQLLAEGEREALLNGVRAAIDEHGGTLTYPLRTWLRLARAI